MEKMGSKMGAQLFRDFCSKKFRTFLERKAYKDIFFSYSIIHYANPSAPYAIRRQL